MKKIVFKSPQAFKRYLASHLTDFSYPLSKGLRRYSFAEKSGKVHRMPSMPAMMRKVNALWGLTIIPEKSHYLGGKFIVRLHNTDFELDKPLELYTKTKKLVMTSPAEVKSPANVVEVVKTEDQVPVQEPMLADDQDLSTLLVDTAKIVEPETEAEVPEVDEVVVFDKDHALSLDNGTALEKKESLYEYGQKLGITLKKNMTFDNMLADLEDQASNV